MSIPLILHQIGPTNQIPDYLQGCSDSWSTWNPSIRRLHWTDLSLREFVADQAPSFLSMFDAFPHGVCKADLGRYLLLLSFGGIYADLDCQCLQEIESLLDGRQLVIATEPKEHLQQKNVQARELTQIVCPSFIASEPGHPLLLDVLSTLRDLDPAAVIDTDDVLDCTGPFLLSRVFANNPSYDEHLIPSKQIYPFSKADCWQGRVFDPLFWSERTRHSFVAHYWDGSWFRPAQQWRSGVPRQAPVNTQDPPWQVARPERVSRYTGSGDCPPLISCLMVTRGRRRQVALAIDCFLAQTYLNSELIIVDDDPNSELASLIATIGSSKIRHVHLPDRDQTLGALRNIALEHALGEYICQWDDDDLYDPVRLEVQWQTLYNTGGQASVLARWMIWWPHLQKLALSCYRDWEGSLLCERSLMPRYPDISQGEDSVILEQLRQSVRLVRVDMPRLYIYVAHGANTFQSDHFEFHWQQSTSRWQGEDTARLERELNRRVPLLSYRAFLTSIAEPLAPVQKKRVMTESPMRAKTPNVLILTPVRDAACYLERYTCLLEELDYDKERLSLALLEGDSNDDTFAALEKLRPRLEQRFRQVEIYQHHLFPPSHAGERWQASLQRDRRERLARIRNRLLMTALQNEDWVLWLDVDICDYPTDLVHQLLAAGREIVTANCLGSRDSSYDLNSFREQQLSEEELRAGASIDNVNGGSGCDYLVDGLWQPPQGVGRDYVDAFRTQPLIELDAVGGTVLLVRAELHRQGLNFPAYPIEGLIETEAFSKVARKLGHRSWALPQLVVRHV